MDELDRQRLLRRAAHPPSRLSGQSSNPESAAEPRPLVAVCSIALLVYGLIETETRRAIAPARIINGLLPEQRAARPTAENILRAFTGLGFQRARTTTGLEALEITTVLPPKG